jgi:long-chain acyl-CoA synthetase
VPEFCDRLAARRPHEVAVRDSRAALSWAELGRLLNRVANGLRDLPVGAERRVAVFADNSIETGVAHLGGLLAGASTVPVNFHFTAAELRYILEDSGARVLFVGPSTVDRALDVAADNDGIAVIGWRCEGRVGLIDFAEWIGNADQSNPPTEVAPSPHLLYTSGTTGVPKGTDLPPSMFASARTVAEHLDEIAQRPEAGMGPHLVAGPMYHTGPLSGFRLLAAGTPVIILEAFDAAQTLRAITDHHVGTTVMVPTHFARLLGLPEHLRRAADVSSLRKVVHTGAPCPPERKLAMIQWWGPVLVEAYGATEVGTVCEIASEDWLTHPGSVGRTLDPFDVVVLDDSERAVDPGTVGRLFFRDHTGRGIIYRNDPQKSAAAHAAPGVFTLGEIGYVDEDGYVYLTDRSADLVLSGGVNVYPAEAENVLLAHVEVFDAACIGMPDADMGERLVALVVPADRAAPPTADALISLCRSTIAHYKCPREVRFVETVERNAMGKISRRRLRDAALRLQQAAER